MHSLSEAMHAGELAGLAAYARAVLGHAAEDEPEVVSLRLSVNLAPGGQASIDCELIGKTGHAVGGFSL